ncbi:hypothetical protein AYO21_09678 [Fonsecaea monophora]|uniref:Cytochrome P450 n=1 Tax=Fonsecaea monophora TaxID=254056 RepID=A0A177EW13_9EURO|nr:hypothetical protein AYO21_09678 [Fonsecaea monophora]OAG36138.1 hypothetical protein AYO21_09678 [Fonsecaea monophora]
MMPFVIVAFLIVLYALYRYSIWTTIPRIEGIPEIPGALPFIGHLHYFGASSGKADATVWTEWSQKYGYDLYQAKFGQTRFLVVNSIRTVKDLWLGENLSIIEKREPFTFKKYIGLDFASMAWTDACKRQRNAAVKAMSKSNWIKFIPAVERASEEMILAILHDGERGQKPLNPLPYMAGVANNLSWLIAYGKSVADMGGSSFFRGFFDASQQVTSIRWSTHQWTDWVPLRRLFPSVHITRAIQAKEKRKYYLDKLYDAMVQDIEQGQDVHCIGADVTLDEKSQLTKEDVQSVCEGMMQGGSETIGATLSCGLGALATAEGQKIQKEAYDAILAEYGSAKAAWDAAFREEKVEYVVALYKEMMRQYVVVPQGAGRMTAKDLPFRGTVLPKGILIFMNLEGANHDKEWYGEDAGEFNPKRWLTRENLINDKGNTPHLGYGAGARMCPAWAISNRILYGLLVRIIINFQITHTPTAPPNTHPTQFNVTPRSSVARPGPWGAIFTSRSKGSSLATHETNDMLEMVE